MEQKNKFKILILVMTSVLLITNFLKSPYKVALAAFEGPELLITELLPISQNSGDAYEYIELYNNNNYSIDLKDYKLPLQNIDIVSSKVIPSKSLVVICTRSNTSLTNFNDFYGINLTEDKYIALPLTAEILNNTAGSVLITKDDNTVVSQVNYIQSDFEVKKSITFKYAQSGFIMDKLSVKQSPTPGTITTSQVPYTGVQVTGITLDKEALSLEVNQSHRLYATVSPTTASNKSLVWTSEDSEIVQIDQNGFLTANSAGVTIITVKTIEGDFMAYCVVIVGRVPVESVSLNRSEAHLQVGNAILLTASVRPVNATNKNITWITNDRNIATVDSNGLVVAKSTGSTIITAETIDGKHVATCTVFVSREDLTTSVSSIELNKEDLFLELGTSALLQAQLKPRSATNKAVIWSSSNSSIVSVDSNGIVTGKILGQSWITAKTVDGGLESKCLVTVTEGDIPLNNIRLSKSFIRVQKGKFQNLTPIFTPGKIKDKSVSWETSDSKIAIVINGKVYGVSEGTAEITVRKGTITTKCIVYVTEEKGKNKDVDKDKGKDKDKDKDKGNGKAKGLFK